MPCPVGPTRWMPLCSIPLMMALIQWCDFIEAASPGVSFVSSQRGPLFSIPSSCCRWTGEPNWEKRRRFGANKHTKYIIPRHNFIKGYLNERQNSEITVEIDSSSKGQIGEQQESQTKTTKKSSRKTKSKEQNSSQTKSKRRTWEESYKDLCQYHKLHGHCNVPQSEKPLGVWVNTQRIEHARYITQQEAKGRENGDASTTSSSSSKNSIPRTSMTPERKAALDAIGFIWDYNGYMWDLRFKELLEFKAAKNHCCVPRSAGSLGAWVEKQRIEYKKFKVVCLEGGRQDKDEASMAEEMTSTILTEERVNKLDEIGFVWDVRERQFQEKIEELRIFQRLNGHIDPRFMTGKLAFFVRRCEQQYRKYLDAPVNSTEALGILPESRRIALEEVGFSRDMFDEPRARTIGNRRATWDERYNELRHFHKEHGHCLVPKKAGSLGSWVRAQRHLMKEQGTVGSFEGGVLSQERVDRLNRLGFVWDVHQWQWNRTFHELLEYKKEHNTTNVPMSYGGLGLWVFNQRAHYNSFRKGKASHMTSARLEMLKSIGFEFDLGKKRLSAADERWQSRLNELRQYVEEWGTLNVQKDTNPSLYNWCQNQKANYRAKLKGLHSPLKKEREEALREIGFFDEIDATEKH